MCGLGAQKVELVAPTDIEGHLGNDKRYYVIDTARVFPPEKPWKTVTGTIELWEVVCRSVNFLFSLHRCIYYSRRAGQGFSRATSTFLQSP